MSGVLTRLEDSPNRAMPLENLYALKAFIQARRQEFSSLGRKYGVEFPDACRSLPIEQQKALHKFLVEVEGTRFLEPDGAPKREWAYRFSHLITWAKVRVEIAECHRTDLRLSSPQSTPDWPEPRHTASEEAALTAVKLRVEQVVYRAICEKSGVKDEKAGDLPGGLADRIASDAGMSAYFMAEALITDGMPSEQKADAERRWEVWSKGYALYGDLFGGKLYVYASTKN